MGIFSVLPIKCAMVWKVIPLSPGSMQSAACWGFFDRQPVEGSLRRGDGTAGQRLAPSSI